MPRKKQKKQLLKNADVRKLVIARLSVLSPNTIISIGADGEFTKDELIKRVEVGDKVGEKIAQIQIEWLQSFKKEIES